MARIIRAVFTLLGPLTFTFTAYAAATSRQASTTLPNYVLEFAPLSFLFSGEQLQPADVAMHLQHVTPKNAQDGALATSVSFATIGSFDNGTFLTANDDPFATPRASWFLGVKPDSTGFTSSPATIIVVPKSGGIVDAFYFYFYSYDHGPFLDLITVDDHVGDWEHSMIRFVNGVPQAFYLSAHSGGTAYTFDAVTKINGRPVSFIASGTHANYITPGDHPHDFPGLFDHTGQGTLWDVTLNFRGFLFDIGSQMFTPAGGASVGAQGEVQGEGVGWLNFLGVWGDHQYPLFFRGQYCIDIPNLGTQCKLVNGPTGPVTKNLARQAVCQNEADCTINTSV